MEVSYKSLGIWIFFLNFWKFVGYAYLTFSGQNVIWLVYMKRFVSCSVSRGSRLLKSLRKCEKMILGVQNLKFRSQEIGSNLVLLQNLESKWFQKLFNLSYQNLSQVKNPKNLGIQSTHQNVVRSRYIRLVIVKYSEPTRSSAVFSRKNFYWRFSIACLSPGKYDRSLCYTLYIIKYITLYIIHCIVYRKIFK